MKSQVNFSIKPTLEGKKVLLRPFETGDWKIMIEILEDLEVKKLTGSVTSDEEANELLDASNKEKIKDWYQSRNQQTDRLDLAIVDIETGDLVGEVVYNDFNEDTYNVNIRILIGPSGRNRGLGTEAISLFIEYGFQVLNLHKIELEVYSFNPRAEKSYNKNGFILEGIRRENFCYNGEYIDTKLYGILKSDFKNR
ncbi:GNAT family N-acetyltransferase [Lachnoclostridium phytofermentans]|uniref:GCN5-related N-acetyltransferase n=1 Tax=Lachnoclostridium phytofermentans (strain ATCC 700394 / DSM 18823 / ISDg) TaxID=357809 RepID=A9KT00_LACP7|nr:GNAT family protein [Lachnoclostridium phytofermentans]ABX42211.1 GCN5-related N-acetyltransferase [Lachnoclostridium phytofermentans ISDg]